MVPDSSKGSCQISATFCEILGNPGVQKQLDSSWGSCTDKPQGPFSTNPVQESNAAIPANKHHNTANGRNSSKMPNHKLPTPQDGGDDNDRPKLCSHQNIHLTDKSSKELLLLMQDLEQLAAASSKRGMPSSLNP